MQLGICADPTMFARLPASAVADCDFIEGHVQNFLQPAMAEATFAGQATALRSCPLTMPAANCFLPAGLKITGPDVDYARLETYAKTTFRRAKEVGTSLIVFGSAGARSVPDKFPAAQAFEQFVDVLRLLGPLAAAQGVTLVVEPLSRRECNLVNTVVEGAEAVRRADHPHVQLLVDFFHMLRNGESPDDIAKVGSLVRHAHVAEDRDRAPPGARGEDFRPFLRALRHAGYNGGLTIECVWQDIDRQVGPALATLRTQLTDAGYAA